MSTLHAALFLLLASETTSAFAEPITCESDHDRLQACTTVMPGSRIRFVEQLSRAPCIEGKTWGLDTNRNSIWISSGCRAVFDVQPPRDDPYRAEHRRHELTDESRRDEPRPYPGYTSSEPAHADSLRAKARDACIDRAASGQALRPDQLVASNAHWIGHGMLSVSLDTPDGPLTCTVDRDGNVRSIDSQ